MNKKLVLHFPTALVDRPIISGLVREFDVDFNILKASVTSDEGNLVLELTGSENNVERAVRHLKSLGVKVQSLSKDVKMIKDRCTDCSACVPLCPVEALVVDGKTFTVNLESAKCIACGVCIKACPTRALVLRI